MFHRYIFFVRACSWFIYILSIRVHIFCRTSIRSTCGFYKEKYSLYLQGRLLEQWWTWEVGHACTQRANTHIDFRWHAGAHMDVKIFFFVYSFSVISLTYLSEIMILENEPFHDKLRIHEFQAKCRRTQGFSNSHLLHRLTFFVTLWGKNIENRWTWI